MTTRIFLDTEFLDDGYYFEAIKLAIWLGTPTSTMGRLLSWRHAKCRATNIDRDPRQLRVGKDQRGQSRAGGLAIVGQDTIRRDILRERDVPDGANIGLIDTITRYSLTHGYHVVLEGILTASRYGSMLEALRRDHISNSAFFYLDVSIEETLKRHQTRPLRMDVSAEQMREWYQHLDLLPGKYETVIPEHSPLDATVRQMLRESGLANRMNTPAG